MARMSTAEAREKFTEALESARRGEAVVVERYGTPVAVLVSVEQYAKLAALEASTAGQAPDDRQAGVQAAWSRVKARHDGTFRKLAEYDRSKR